MSFKPTPLSGSTLLRRWGLLFVTLRPRNKNRKCRVDKACRYLLLSGDDHTSAEAALDVLNEWRSFHTFPLNSITVGLRQKSRRIYQDALVVQRLKRARSILAKLIREPSMRLTQMQDIGGGRAVLDSVESVYQLKESYLNKRRQYEVVHIRSEEHTSELQSLMRN